MTMNGGSCRSSRCTWWPPRSRGAAGEAGRDHPERHPQGVHGPQHLIYPPKPSMRNHLRHLRLHQRQDAEVQLDLDLRLPHPGGRCHSGSGAGLHAGRRRGLHQGRAGRRPIHRQVRAAAVVLLGHRDELLHGGRQAARRGCCGASWSGSSTQEREIAVAAHAFADLGLVADRAGPVQQRRPHLHRGDGRHAGHTQSLHTNALDEALALPTDFSARIARNTQLLLQQESGTTRPIDPWGGSYYVEWLTHQLAEKAARTSPRQHGGMAQAISDGIPSCASRRPPRAPRPASTPASRR